MPGTGRHTPVLAGKKAVRIITTDTALLSHIGDVLESLTKDWNWVKVGDDVQDVLDAAYQTLDQYYAMQLIGSVSTFLVVPPPGWLVLDGATHDKDDYPELHAVLPSQLKTESDFTLPDMDGAFVAGEETEGNLGTGGGANTYALTVAQLPAHTHTYTPPVLTVDAETPAVPIPTAGIGAPIATGSTGSGDDVDNRPKFVLFTLAVYAGRE